MLLPKAKLSLARESLVSDIPAGDGETAKLKLTANPFYSVLYL
jgi:hypothetical protein